MAILAVVSTGTFALVVFNPLSYAGDAPPTVETLTRDAEEIVAGVLEAYPQDPDSLALMGRLRSYHGDTSEAETYWKRSLELDPRRADIHDALARMAWERGEFEKTAAACRQALRLEPTMPGVQALLGRSLLELGQVEEAIAALEAAVSSTGRGHFYLAQAYMQSKAYEKARDSYLRAVEKHPDNAQAYYGLSLASLRLGQPEKAKQYREAFRKYGVDDPESVRAQKRSPKQLSGLDQARSIMANACTGAADIYRRHGNMQQAERLWRRAATIEPNDFASRRELLELYERSGRLEDARIFFEQLTQMPFESPWDHWHLGHLYLRLERHDEAERAYRNVIRLAPGRPEGYEALVQLYLATGRKLPAAKELAFRAVELRPGPGSYFLLAQVHTRLGERADALAALERALEMDPGNVPCRRLYTELKTAG